MPSDKHEFWVIGGGQHSDPARNLTLGEMLSKVTHENLQPEFSFGIPVGREVIEKDDHLKN